MATITITNDVQMYRALGLIYGNEEEAVDNMVALVAYTGEAHKVFEVDCVSFWRGRGYIIMDDTSLLDYLVQDDLRRSHAKEVIWNPMFEVVGTLVYDATEDHLSRCDMEVPRCRVCMDAFGMVPG